MALATIASFSFAHEAYIARAKLESEGIPVALSDEHTIRDLCINRNNHQNTTFHQLGYFIKTCRSPAGTGFNKITNSVKSVILLIIPIYAKVSINMQWLYSNALGGVKVQVPTPFAEQAIEILLQDNSDLLECELTP